MAQFKKIKIRQDLIAMTPKTIASLRKHLGTIVNSKSPESSTLDSDQLQRQKILFSCDAVDSMIEKLIFEQQTENCSVFQNKASREPLDKQLPFYSAILPVADFSETLLLSVHPDYGQIFSDKARTSAHTWLIQSISRYLAPLIHHFFDLKRRTELSELQRMHVLLSGSAGSELYEKFNKTGSAYSFLWLFRDFPAAKSMCIRTVRNWLIYFIELAERVSNDSAILYSSHRVSGQESPIVQSALFGNSDPHTGNKAVAVIETKTQRWIYKPRYLGPALEFQSLLERISSLAPKISFKSISIYCMDGYGWIEYVEHKECISEKEVGDFYFRAGFISAILFVLGANDMHADNLVAAGAFPVIIDFETLSSGCKIPKNSRWNQRLMAATYASTPLYMGLLPYPECRASGKVFDDSALGNVKQESTGTYGKKWYGLGTDAIRQTNAEELSTPKQNVVKLQGKVVQPGDFLQNLLEGYQYGWESLLNHMDELAHLLDTISTSQSRIIVRSTNLYYQILNQSLSPPLMASDHERLDFIRKCLSGSVSLLSDSSVKGCIENHEANDILLGDIPIFVISGNEGMLHASDEDRMGVKFTSSKCVHIFDKTRLMTAKKMLGLHLEIIRGSTLRLEIKQEETKNKQINRLNVSTGRQATRPWKYEAIQSLTKIGNNILKDAVQIDQKPVMWNVTRYIPEAGIFGVRPMTIDLYEGRIGIAVFLATAYIVSGEYHFRDAAIAVCDGVIKSMEQATCHNATLSPYEHLGIMGVGGVIYGLVKCAQILRERHLLLGAESVAQRVSVDHLQADPPLDVIDGLAGLGLALLALEKKYPTNKIADGLIEVAAKHLIRKYKVESAAWKTERSNLALAGFSHGVSGIALFLDCYGKTRSDPTASLVAEEAIQYENSLFDPAFSNWHDLRKENCDCRPMNGWCHGATGIGLSRLAAMERTGKDYATDVHRALRSLEDEYRIASFDSLCCGTAGRLDFLIEYNKIFNCSISLLHASRLVAELIDLQNLRLTRRRASPRLHIGLYRGISGIGYVLARYIDPHAVPCVLSLQ